MKIENPFESGHIKNYILAYIGVVVIMVLFFFAATLWNEPNEYPKKEFATRPLAKEQKKQNLPKAQEKKEQKSKIKLLDGGY